MKYVLALALTTALASPALALQVPQPAPLPSGASCKIEVGTVLPAGCDPHVRLATYQEHGSVLLVGAVGRAMSIKFAPDERINLINFETPPNIGGKAQQAPWQTIDAEALKDHPLTNVLPLWAMQEGRSSLQVVTMTQCPVGGLNMECKGVPRIYIFQLTTLTKQKDQCSGADCDDPNLMTAVEFIYPDDVRRTASQRFKEDQQLRLEKAAADRLTQDVFYGARNWRYIVKGKPSAIADLAPDEVSDNSQNTAFIYNGRRELPSMYVIDPNKVNPPRQITPDPKNNGMFVLWESDRMFRLIKGQEIIEIARLEPVGPPGMYPKRGENPHTGTSSPSVLRTIRASN